LRALHLTASDFEPEEGQVDGTTAHALERVIGLLAREAGLRIVERGQLAAARPGPAAG
jgi:lipopolysaccharide biosynthesis protein